MKICSRLSESISGQPPRPTPCSYSLRASLWPRLMIFLIKWASQNPESCQHLATFSMDRLTKFVKTIFVFSSKAIKQRFYVLTNWGASNPPRTIQLKSEVYFIECIYHEMFDVRLQLNLCQTQTIKLLLFLFLLQCKMHTYCKFDMFNCSSFKL